MCILIMTAIKGGDQLLGSNSADLALLKVSGYGAFESDAVISVSDRLHGVPAGTCCHNLPLGVLSCPLTGSLSHLH